MRIQLLIALFGCTHAADLAAFEAGLAENVDLGRLHRDLADLDDRLGNSADVDAEIALLKEAYRSAALDDAHVHNGTCKDEDIISINRKSAEAKDLFEGDVLLTNDQLYIIERAHETNRSRRQAMKEAGYSWGKRNPVIPYSYSRGFPQSRRSYVKAAMDHWSKYTCVQFKETSSGYRMEVQDSDGCASYVGKINQRSGTQALFLAEACMNLGTITHELSHAFGFFHVQSRYDRNTYVDIDFSNIDKAEHNNFDLEPADRTDLYDIPYEFGSNMHYYHKDFSIDDSTPVIFAKPAYKVYQEGMMGRLPTFYDILAVNKHFECFANCKTSVTCKNSGVQDVKNCNQCACPLGWTGKFCDERPAGTKTVSVTSSAQTIRSQLGSGTKGTTYQTQYYLFKAPSGKKVRLTPTVLGGTWDNSCASMGLEVKFLKNQAPSGVQVCDFRVKHTPITSETNEMLVQAYTLGEQSVIQMEVKAV